MKKNSVVLTAVLFGVAAGTLAHAQAPAAAPTKIAVINFSEAMAKTKEGQKAGAELTSRFSPKSAEDEKRKADIQALTDKLNKGRATLSEDAQKQLAADIQTKSTSLKRFEEDARSDAGLEEQKITNDLQAKLFPMVSQYAIQNNFAVVLDIGSQQSPVLWAASATNITDIMVALYDQAHPVVDGAGTAPKPPAAKPPVAPPVAKPPAAAPPTKK